MAEFARMLKKKGERVLDNFRYHNVDTAADGLIRMIDPPELSREDKDEIDAFWGRYHVQFRNYKWFQVFYAVTGQHDPRFIPQPFAERVLYRYYNEERFLSAYEDKSMFSSFLPNVRFPELLGKRINGKYYDTEGNYYGDDITESYISKLYDAFRTSSKAPDSIIIKESVDTRQGLGVRKYSINDKEDFRESLYAVTSKNVVIQPAIRQHPFFSSLNKDSVNIIRLTTWRMKDKVYIFAPCIRFGLPGRVTDIAYVNGIEIINVLGIRDGIVFNEYVCLDGTRHPLPDGMQKRVPYWNEIVRMVTEGALQLPWFDFIGWDVTVDDEGQVICIEYNLRYPGSIVYQFAHGPLAGEYTEEFLSFLLNIDNIGILPRTIRKVRN